MTGSTGTPFLADAGATGAWKNKTIKSIIMNNNNSKKNVWSKNTVESPWVPDCCGSV